MSRVWRKVQADWEAWNARSLAEEPIVRLILDDTAVRARILQRCRQTYNGVVSKPLRDPSAMMRRQTAATNVVQTAASRPQDHWCLGTFPDTSLNIILAVQDL